MDEAEAYCDPLNNKRRINIIDVFVTLENDDYYLIEVTTPKFFYTLMEKFKSNFVTTEYPYIIVSKLVDEIMKSAIQEFIDAEEDLYRLKLL